MIEKLGGITLLIVSIIGIIIIGDNLLYNVGLIPLAIYTMGVLGFIGAVYTLIRI